MKLLVSSIILLGCSVFGVHADQRNSYSVIALPFRYYGIAPEFADIAPTAMCQVDYPSGVSARLGNILDASDVTEAPEVKWNCDPYSVYTIVAFDPDVLGTGNKLLSEGRLWFVANITDCDVDQGETIVEYLPPIPFAGSGDHRIVIFVYKQKEGVYFEEPFVWWTEIKHRFYTSNKKFAVQYDLGEPVAGNFYLCHYDSRVEQTLNELERPYPAYFVRAIQQANLSP